MDEGKKKLDDELKPTREVRRATELYLDEFMTHQEFDKPNAGGYDEQPAEWVEAMACIKAAYNKAKSVLEASYQEDQRKAQERAKNKAKRK